ACRDERGERTVQEVERAVEEERAQVEVRVDGRPRIAARRNQLQSVVGTRPAHRAAELELVGEVVAADETPRDVAVDVQRRAVRAVDVSAREIHDLQTEL